MYRERDFLFEDIGGDRLTPNSSYTIRWKKHSKKELLTFLIVVVTIISISCKARIKLDNETMLGKFRQFRTAQKIYHTRHGEYGTEVQLFASELIPSNLFGTDDGAYSWEIRCDGNDYSIVARPRNPTGGYFFMDATGIIRSSYSSEIVADKNSEAIKNQ